MNIKINKGTARTQPKILIQLKSVDSGKAICRVMLQSNLQSYHRAYKVEAVRKRPGLSWFS